MYSYSQHSFFIGREKNISAPIVVDGYNCYDDESNLSGCNLFENGMLTSNCTAAGGVMCEGNAVSHLYNLIRREWVNENLSVVIELEA